MGSPIPIQNIYYLLCYAWNRLDEKDIVDVESLESTEIADLFARVLISGTHHLLRRGFDRGYLEFREDTRRPRGKIDLATTITRNLLRQNRLDCEFDELNYNVLHNQILKTTITNLMSVGNLDDELKKGLYEINHRLWEIRQVPLSTQLFRKVQLHRNNYYYGFLMNVCELIHDSLLTTEDDGGVSFRDFLRDERKMGRLFESFVKNFYDLEQEGFKVQRLKIAWQAEGANHEAETYLPEMKTDVCLISEQRKIILDCKFYAEALQVHFGKQKVHSEHLYQLFAYLKNKESDNGWGECEGILLYPAVQASLDIRYKIQGHLVSGRTVDLNQNWQAIHNDMLRILAA